MADSTRIEFLFPANHVEAVNGLLYMNGGGWTDVYRPATSPDQIALSQIGVVAALRVPWTELHQPHRVTVWMASVMEETAPPLFKLDAQVTVGQPRHGRQDSDQHVMLGFPVSVSFPQPGAYRICAQVDNNEEVKQWDFWVHDAPTPG